MQRILFTSVIALLVAVQPGFSDALPSFHGPVILTVTGLPLADHPDGEAIFDLPILEALGQTKIETTSIWTDGKHVFTGVPLAALVHLLKIEGTNLRLHALNDYAADIPAAEVEDNAPILAYEMDGAPMPVRDKGPIWVIYPYDADARYRTDTSFTRSVWELDRIDVLR